MPARFKKPGVDQSVCAGSVQTQKFAEGTGMSKKNCYQCNIIVTLINWVKASQIIHFLTHERPRGGGGSNGPP